MRYYLDTEFLNDGNTIDVISLGVVAEDGREFYAENADLSRDRLARDPWLAAHVLPYLDRASAAWAPARIADQLRQFAGALPEWWGYFAAHDWVLLCQLYGGLMCLPNGWPRYCRDLRQELDRLGLPIGHPVERRHHALDDARWIRDTWARYVRGERTGR